MRFGRTLRSSTHPEWKDKYIDYAKLKSLLREDAEERVKWTEDDENKFCDEIFNVQLEKVAAFQESTFKSLEQRASKAAEKLHDLAPEEGNPKGTITTERFKELEKELDGILDETKRLKKYSDINYTGFKIRPMLMTSLSKRPFNSEQGYHPLLNKLSTIFFVVRQQLDESETNPAVSSSDAQSQTHNGERYTAYKCELIDCPRRICH
jgi:SPX domain protein involved in polyphosphate accumulation